MPESDLSMTYALLRERIAFLLGYSRTSTDWSTGQANNINDSLARGLRRFYNPPKLPGQTSTHQWRFLRPTAGRITTISGQYQQPLPEDFGFIDGDMTYGPDQAYRSIPITSEENIRNLRSDSSTTGVPIYAAIVPLTSLAETGQRFAVQFWPTPGGAYPISYRYSILPFNLSSTKAYPLGGQAHAETILESCLAAAESTLNDSAGLHEARFMERLVSSVDYDCRQAPEFLGYNGNPSRGGFMTDDLRSTVTVTVGGVTP